MTGVRLRSKMKQTTIDSHLGLIPMQLWRFLTLVSVVYFLLPTIASSQDKKPTSAAIQFFESKVRPVLVENCFECHADKKHRGGLRIDSLAAMLEGGDTGPAIVPGHPEKSLLV